jgi:protein-disulfide isomerase
VPSRLIAVYVGGRQDVRVDAYQHPILGSPEAKYIVVKLFDYTCGHCRELHGHLVAAREKFGDDFAVLMLPVPMNPDCNQYVRGRSEKHADACQLAALALAVWRVDATKFEEFDRWLFEPEHPPRASEARAKAVRLVGEENLDSALGDWRLSQRMVVGIELYKMAGAGAIPKILAQKTKLTGGVHDREVALEQLARELGIE